MLYPFLFIMFILALIGCDGRTDVVEPEPNQPPVIDRVILPNQIEANTPIKLQVITRDVDKDSLTIIWEVSAGTVADDVWTPPDRATQVVISAHVTDGKNPTVTQSRNVTVTKTQTVEPPPPQPEPPDEPDVSGEWNIIGRVGIEHVAPGQETVKVSIGDTVEQVNALAIRAEWLGHDNQTLAHPRLGAFHCLYENGKTIGITIADARYKTAEGIGIGSHTDDMVAKYGEPDNIDRGKQLTFYNYFKSGYIFGFGDTKHVVIITVRG